MNLKELSDIHEKFVALHKRINEFPPLMREKMNRDADVILSMYQSSMMNFCDGATRFLHNLDDCIHDENMIVKVIETFPQAFIEESCDDGLLPIQRAAMFDKSVLFVPILAKEGMKINLGGERRLGGLLMRDSIDHRNVIQTLVLSHENGATIPLSMRAGRIKKGNERKYIQTLKQLDTMGLLPESELVNATVLKNVHIENCSLRFRFIFERHPHALQAQISNLGDIPIHWAATNLTSFMMCLEYGMQYYPEKFGFILQKNAYNQSALEIAISCLGKEKVLNCVYSYIPVESNFLHHIVRHSPCHLKDFVINYRTCINRKDDNGQLPLHVLLSHGKEQTSRNILQITDASVEILDLILLAHDSALTEKDPVNGLYPFMIPAVQEINMQNNMPSRKDKSSLNAIYTLLRRNPNACLESI
ncbi:hypothetical protein CTEN210_06051 [Chaetoceros tenuissimus]|uniref:Uncharacterized protein n=1 Tax=Chaetoceros tenuissimus TaxID=426638 RepID=A0AAD3CRL3_9STRA|nr:hypothetical protein CTEN210_06051 [Chaetoceros tenuissimus]